MRHLANAGLAASVGALIVVGAPTISNAGVMSVTDKASISPAAQTDQVNWRRSGWGYGHRMGMNHWGYSHRVGMTRWGYSPRWGYASRWGYAPRWRHARWGYGHWGYAPRWGYSRWGYAPRWGYSRWGYAPRWGYSRWGYAPTTWGYGAAAAPYCGYGNAWGYGNTWGYNPVGGVLGAAADVATAPLWAAGAVTSPAWNPWW